MRRLVTLLAGTAIAATVLSGLAGPASASFTPGVVTLPAHVPTTTDLTLLGESDGNTAAVRNGGAILHGAGVLRQSPAGIHLTGGLPVHEVDGNILRWAEPRATGTHWVVHKVDMQYGYTWDYDADGEVVAFTPDGWVTWSRSQGTLTSHVPGGYTFRILTGIATDTSSYDPPVVKADRDGAVVLYTSVISGVAHLKLVLIQNTSLQTSTTEVLADHDSSSDTSTVQPIAEQLVTATALTPSTVVWEGLPQAGGPFGAFYRRSRAGGDITTIHLPGYQADRNLTATDTEIATTQLTRTFPINFTLTLWHYVDGAWNQVALPSGADFGGMAATDNGFAVAFGGDIATRAGVYMFGSTLGGTLSKVASVDPGTETISDVSLNAGRLTYGERPVGAPTDGPVPLWRASVGSGEAVSVGAEAPFAPSFAVRHARNGVRPALSVSGDRTAVRTNWVTEGQQPLVLDEGGAITDVLPQVADADRSFRQSGKFFMVDSKVYVTADVNDSPAAHPPLRDFSSLNCRGADLYGSTVVCSLPGGSVRLWDVARPTTSTNPTTIGSNADGPIAIWGTTVAWHRTDSQIVVQRVRGGPVTLTKVSGKITELRMSEGTLSWQDATGRIILLNLDAPTSVPRDSGLKAPGEVDDHLIAGLTTGRTGGLLQVRALPFGLTTKHRPRLISQTVPAGFTPGVWQPTFEFSKAVTDVTLTLKRGSTVVATLHGSGEAGVVRDVQWDGKATGGTQAPAGTYTWTLDANAKDGDGSVTNASGLAPVTGTVKLTP